MNEAYADTVIETEALQCFSTMTLTADAAHYTVPTSILRIKAMYVTPVGAQRSVALKPASVEQIINWSVADQGSQSGQYVTHYTLIGTTKMMFFPTPQAADVVTIYYVKLPDVLSGDSDVPEIQEPYVTKCIEAGASYKAALFLNDPNALIYKRDYDEAVRQFRGHLRRKQGAMTMSFRVLGADQIVPHDPSTDLR